MQLGNIKDLLLKSLGKTWKQNQVIASIIYKSIKDDFLELKKIDITPYIISIQLRENIIILKTNKPILNSEIKHIEGIIIKNILQKLENIWIHIKNLELFIK
jgi:hypothetical protein